MLAERAAGATRVSGLPFYYSIHLNKPCNQACIMCVPTGLHGREALSLEEFTALFEQIRPYAEHLTLIGGETFMYPHIPEVLEMVSEHPIEVTVNSNCTMLDDRVLGGLMSLHALNLKASIDAATRETYRRVRGRDHFDRARANMERFAGMVRDAPHLRLIPIYVVMRENLHEVLPFIEWAHPLGPHRIEFHPVRHVESWQVENGTGWHFDGSEQVCESFSDEYNEVMAMAAARCEEVGLECETHIL
jgi:MoaA/NifB/PqqE/SkfB family radical SAM enzyme